MIEAPGANAVAPQRTIQNVLVFFPLSPPLIHVGGVLPSGPRLQERQRRFSAGSGALLDLLPEGAAQLLGAGRLLLLFRRAPVPDQRHAGQPEAGSAGRVHHAI